MKTALAAAVFGLALLGGLAQSASAAPAQSSKIIKLPPDNVMATLKPGPGVEVVTNNCAICHSTDYIVRQPGGDAQHWEPEVRKMAKVYGAPLSEADIRTIVQYLASAYGPAASPAPSRPPTRQKEVHKMPSSPQP